MGCGTTKQVEAPGPPSTRYKSEAASKYTPSTPSVTPAGKEAPPPDDTNSDQLSVVTIAEDEVNSPNLGSVHASDISMRWALSNRNFMARDDTLPSHQRLVLQSFRRIMKNPDHSTPISCAEARELRAATRVDGNQVINRYTVFSSLGKGPRAQVRLVANMMDAYSFYALKVYNRSLLTTLRDQRRVTVDYALREIAILKNMTHPNLLSLREVVDDPPGNKLYILTDYAVNGMAFKISTTPGSHYLPVPPAKLRCHLTDMLSALSYLHSNWMLHRNLKLENVLVTRWGHLVLTDYGMRSFLDHDPVGSEVVYTAPELVEGCEASTACDVWSLGVVLFAMVFDRLPFDPSSHTTARRVSHGVKIPTKHGYAHGLQNDVPPELISLINGLLQRSPSSRLSVEQIETHPFLNRSASPPLPPVVTITMADMAEAVKVGCMVGRIEKVTRFILGLKRLAKHWRAVCRQVGSKKGGTTALLPLHTSISVTSFSNDLESPGRSVCKTASRFSSSNSPRALRRVSGSTVMTDTSPMRHSLSFCSNTKRTISRPYESEMYVERDPDNPGLTQFEVDGTTARQRSMRLVTNQKQLVGQEGKVQFFQPADVPPSLNLEARHSGGVPHEATSARCSIISLESGTNTSHSLSASPGGVSMNPSVSSPGVPRKSVKGLGGLPLATTVEGDDDPAQVKDIIDRVLAGHEYCLDLGCLSLRSVPPAAFSATWLTTLDLFENKLKGIPTALCSITTLEVLNIASNEIEELPSEIGQLKNLKHFLADQNQITALPSSMSTLSQLEVVGLDWNQFTEFPTCLTHIASLQKIHLAENFIESFPPVEELQRFKSLTLAINNTPRLQGQYKEYLAKLPNIEVHWHKVYPDRILHFMYLGSLRSAQSPEIYKELNIGYIATIGRGLRVVLGEETEQMEINVDDNPGEPLRPHFEAAHEFFETARKNNRCVLVHCFAGLSRSVTMVISYLIRYYNMTVEEALDFVRTSRPAANPNEGFLYQLERYREELDQEDG